MEGELRITFYLLIYLARGCHSMFVCGGGNAGGAGERQKSGMWDGRPAEEDRWEQAHLVTGGWRHSLPVAHIFLLKQEVTFLAENKERAEWTGGLRREEKA